MTDAAPPEILAIGEAMAEFNQTVAGKPDYLQGFGGDTSNFAIAAARQGARAGYISALGADTYGGMLRELWRAEGVDQRHVITNPNAFTAIYFVTHGKAGHEFSFYRAGSAASRYAARDVPLAAIASAKALHLSGISLAISASASEACHAAVQAARGAGVMVSFDTNLRLKLWSKARAEAAIFDMLARCDIALPSHDDITALTGPADPDAVIDRILSLGPRIVALKLGSQGALVADSASRFRIPPLSVNAVDATGAGDTFGGAFLARIIAGDGLDKAGRYAAAAAALSTLGYGAVAPIPRADDVLRAMGGVA